MTTPLLGSGQLQASGIETTEPGSDGWWLNQCYVQLRMQQRYCQRMWERYSGNPPIPFIADTQKAAVKWFVAKARTNFERLIVTGVLSRLRIRGIKTGAQPGSHGDPEAYQTWKKSRGKLWSIEVHRFALSMSRGYVIVGVNDAGALQVTAEDPRQVTAIVDPADPFKVYAALKLIYNPGKQRDEAYLYLPGRIRVAYRNRAGALPLNPVLAFHPGAFFWSEDMVDDDGQLLADAASSEPEWLQANPSQGLEALCPVIPFVNEDGMAEFEPHVHLLDRINQQILQRMQIATIQAFRQRGIKNLPTHDPQTGEKIDYNNIFTADPGAIWHLPGSAEMWESGMVDLTPILTALRDDVRDLAAVSGTPLYSITPDAANGSAMGAALQRETMTFKVESRQDLWEIGHEKVLELIFRTTGDAKRSVPGTVEIVWAPADRASIAEKASGMAQTKGIMPVEQSYIEIWGADPDEAASWREQLVQDIKDGISGAPAPPPGAPGGPPLPDPGQTVAPPRSAPPAANHGASQTYGGSPKPNPQDGSP